MENVFMHRADMEKAEYQELYKRIDEVLYYIWDPIGVSEQLKARSEYENYVPKVMKSLIENEEVQPISACLSEIAEKEIGLGPNEDICNYTAKVLLKFKYAVNKNKNTSDK